MGMFKSMTKGFKDMKEMVNTAPDMIEQAQGLAANAQAMRASYQQQAAAAAADATQSATATTSAAELEPIAGVSIETFAQVCKGLAAYNYDQTKAPGLAAARGIDAAAHEGGLATGTVAVLGGGVDDVYPSEHASLYARIAEQGCIVSESEPGRAAAVGVDDGVVHDVVPVVAAGLGPQQR